MKITIYIFLILAITCVGFGCKEKEKKTTQPEWDLAQIKDSTELTAITLSGSTSYFIYKGEPMGYEYELLKNFAESQGLKLNIKVAQNTNELLEMLKAGKGDLIMYNLPITKEIKTQVLFCGRETVDEQVLIQRASRGDTILKDVTEIIGKEVSVVNQSKYYNRLVNLNNELGGGIIIKEIQKDTISVEDLIGLVSNGQVRYTLCDKNVALLNKTYYPNINVSLVVSHPQRSSWAVRKTSPNLAKALDMWFKENKNSPRYQAIMKRYFEISKISESDTVPQLLHGKISPFDHFFKKYAPIIGWDWKLVASIAYQESRFDTTGVSWAGAVGLMGLMPRTAKAFGLDPEERTNPEGSIRASMEYIKALKRSYSEIEDPQEKIKFVLASYNAGIGHIYDAQALAKKLGKNPGIWEDNVEECLKLKSLPEYYNDSVCKLGYFRGSETINYVRQVVDRWNLYQEKIK